MARINLRVPDKVAKEVKALAGRRGTQESEMWRTLIQRGLDADNHLSIHVMIETLCLARRQAAFHDREILKKAKDDARHILREIGQID